MVDVTQADRDDDKALVRILSGLHRADFKLLQRYIERSLTAAEMRGALAMREAAAQDAEQYPSRLDDMAAVYVVRGIAQSIRSINPDTIGESHE